MADIHAVIVVNQASLAQETILGLPSLIRTIRALKQAGCHRITLTGTEAQRFTSLIQEDQLKIVTDILNYSGVLTLSGSVHYDPQFIRYLVEHSILSPESAYSQVPRCWWQPLDEPQGFQKAESKLFDNIRNQTEGWIAKSINKTISFFLTRYLVKTSVTPNQITFANLAMAFVASFLMINESWGIRVLGASLMAFSSIVDGCDGEVARLKFLSSKSGAWFDTIADDLSNNLFFIALFAGLYRSTGNTLYWQVGWWAFFISLGVTAVIYHQLLTTKNSANAKDFKPAWEKEKDKKSWFERIRPLMKRDFFIFVIFIFVVINLRPIVFWIAVIATLVTFCLYLFSFISQLCRDKKINP